MNTFVKGGMAISLYLGLACSLLGAPVDLDATFGTAGKVTTDFGDIEVAYGLVVQKDGKIVLGGGHYVGPRHPAFALVRYLKDGSLDTSFGGDGKVITSMGQHDLINSLAIQKDGKVVAAGMTGAIGNHDFAVLRYNADGSLDATFNGTGFVATQFGGDDQAAGVAVQEDGRIVVVGYTSSGSGQIAVARYNSDGSLDSAFSNTGMVTTSLGGGSAIGAGVAIQNDGKILAVGGDSSGSYALVRYNLDGSLDQSFNNRGYLTGGFGKSHNPGRCLALQPDGKIIVAGETYSSDERSFGLARYNPDGTLDLTFNGTGAITTVVGNTEAYVWAVALQLDGRIVLSGTADYSDGDFLVYRYNPNGTLDTSFNGDGRVITDFHGGNDIGTRIAVQDDGTILVAGYSFNGLDNDFAVARFVPMDDADHDGIADRYETLTGIFVSNEDTGTNPNRADSDGDGLADGLEVFSIHSDANKPDTDGDGWEDGYEVSHGYSPIDPLSSPDVISSIRTAVEFRFNAANNVSYRIEESTDLVDWVSIETAIIGNGHEVVRFYSLDGRSKRFLRARRN